MKLRLDSISTGKLSIALFSALRREPVDAEVAAELRQSEQAFTEALVAIIASAESLLDLLDDPDRAWDAVSWAGSTVLGPFGPQWEKALAAAVRANAIRRYATTPR